MILTILHLTIYLIYIYILIHIYNSRRYERDGYLGGYKRISAFDCPTNPEGHPIVRVVYQGGVHYDSMVL